MLQFHVINHKNMFCQFTVIFIISYCSTINRIHGQGLNGKSCTTPDNNAGICLPVENCEFLFNLLMNQNTNNTVREYLRASVCEYVGQKPIVCCPLDQANNIGQQGNGTKLPKSPNCGFSNVTIPRIINGVPAKLGEFPWMVALGYKNAKNPDQPKWFCGGSLITKKHILTAAHCVYNRRDLYLARLGDLDLFSDDDGARPTTILIAKVNIHKDFNPRKYANDIAILTLKDPINNPTVWSVCLPTSNPFRTMSFLNFQPTLAGWGSVTFSGPSSSTLQQIFVPVLKNEQCERAFGASATIDEKILCAGSLNGDKDACGGDSGGPLMHEINEGTNYRVYQIGIVSYGFRCAEPGYPAVYTRVSAFIDWIEANLD